jgi:hypothetical protein
MIADRSTVFHRVDAVQCNKVFGYAGLRVSQDRVAALFAIRSPWSDRIAKWRSAYWIVLTDPCCRHEDSQRCRLENHPMPRKAANHHSACWPRATRWGVNHEDDEVDERLARIIHERI